MSLFLDRLNLPVRNSDAAEKPDAMRNMQSNKRPGPVSLLNSLKSVRIRSPCITAPSESISLNLSSVITVTNPRSIGQLDTFFSCSLLARFWQNYFDTTSKILSVTFPHGAIFWLPVDYNWFTSNQWNILAFISLLARRRLLLQQKSTKLPPALSDTTSKIGED